MIYRRLHKYCAQEGAEQNTYHTFYDSSKQKRKVCRTTGSLTCWR